MKQKGLIDLGLRQVVDLSDEQINLERFLSPEVGLLRSLKGIEDIGRKIFTVGQPYRLTEGRVVYMRSGYVRVRVNLIDTVMEGGQLRVVSPGTVLQIMDLSSDFDCTMLAFSNSFMENWQKESFLSAYMQGRADVLLVLDEVSRRRVDSIFQLLWEVLHDEPFSKSTVQALISAFFHQIEYFQGNRVEGKVRSKTRQEELFGRFIDLVNINAVRERRVSFYAGALCVTPHYLSTLIHEVSGRTVMDWVNEAVVQEAKLMLCHTDKLVYQIADELHFPNPSFFCKFFRRITGKSPNEYRQGLK